MARRLLIRPFHSFALVSFALVSFALVLAACAGDVDPVELTDSDSGTEVTLETGDRIEVRLESNPSTGYAWELDPTSGAELVNAVSFTHEEPDTDLVGAAGTDVFVFEAARFGAGVLRLEYVRSFDDPVIPERVVEFILRIDGAPWPPDTGEPPATTTVTAPTTPAADGPDDGVIGVADLYDGEGSRDATVAGFVVSDLAGTRLCEVLMESFPPQCGGMWIVIANPEGLEVELSETGDVRWTDLPVELTGHFDGHRFILDEEAGLVVPTEADEALVASFLAYAAAPGPATADALPFADEVAIGLRDELLATIAADELADPAVWTLDVGEFEGFVGPFSVLDLNPAEPVIVTIGAHPRCAAPPPPPPADVAELRRVSLQPEGATSCLEWWTIDFFVDDDGVVHAVTLDLFGP